MILDALFIVLPFLMESGRIFLEFPVTLSLFSLIHFLDVGIFSHSSIRVNSDSGDVGFRSSGKQSHIRYSHTITSSIIFKKSAHHFLLKKEKHPYIQFDTSQPRPYETPQQMFAGLSMLLRMCQENQAFKN